MNNNNLTINSVEELRSRLDKMAAEFTDTNNSCTTTPVTDTAYRNDVV